MDCNISVFGLCVLALCIATGSCLEIHTSNDMEILQFNRTTLISVLSRLAYLGVHLRQSSDSSHTFIRYVLMQSEVPVYLTVGTGIGEYVFEESQVHRCIVVDSPENNLSSVTRHATREGVLFSVFDRKLDQDAILKLARKMWVSQGIYKVYYVSPSTIVFFNPFERRNTNEFGFLLDVHQTALRLENIFKNLNGYPVRTYIFDSVYSAVYADEDNKKITRATGVDSNIAYLLSRTMNFTIDFQFPDDEFFGSHLENGSFDGAIGRMIRYETDITLTGFFVKDYLTKEIEFSVSVYMDELCCYVMKAKRIPQSILPIFAVDIDIWLSFLLTGLFCPVFWMGIRHLNLLFSIDTIYHADKQRFGSFQYMRIFIDTWVVWVRVNVVRYPPFYSERIFLVSLCLVSVIFGALFESSLATAYIRPLYYKDINTLEELAKRNFRIYIKHAAMRDDLFFGHSSIVYQNLERKLLLVAETEERLISMMAKRGGFAAVTRSSSLILTDIRYIITKKIHMIPECPKNYHIAFVFPKHSPFAEPVNVLLLKFLGAGLINRWIDEMKYQARISIYNFPSYVINLEHTWKILTLHDLQLSFYALIFGTTSAAFAFTWEFFWRMKINLRKSSLCIRWKRFNGRVRLASIDK